LQQEQQATRERNFGRSSSKILHSGGITGSRKLHSFSWTRRLTRYVKAGQYEKTMELFQQMQQAGMSPNRFTFLSVLNACASLRAIEKGRCVHEEIIQSGDESDAIVGSSLIDMYAKCESMEDAHRVFNRMPTRNAISWTSMIQGYVRCGEGKRALELFWQMQQDGV
jgi:pentatricopeptide repeat protein